MKRLFYIFLVISICALSACENNETVNKETGIILSEQEIVLYEEQTATIYASYESGNTCTPFWESSDSMIVSISSIAKQGSKCLIKALAAGKEQIIAKDDKLQAFCNVIILEDSFYINTNKLILFPGCDTTLNVWYKSGKAVHGSWSSSNEEVVKVSYLGVVSAIGAGTAVISVTSGNDILECEVIVREYSGQTSNHTWVDLGLSVRWATMNVDATSETDYGGWYCWGEIEPKYSVSWSTYKWYDNDYPINWGDLYSNAITKYTIDDGWHKGRWYEEKTTTTVVDGVTTYETIYVFVGDNKRVLDSEDDVATVKWGGQWRMPSKSECQELVDKCRCVYGSIDGVMGTKIIGPNGQSIFIPAAGYADPDGKPHLVGESALFWSNEIGYFTSNAFYLHLQKECECKSYDRIRGYSIRPVCPFE